MNTLYKQLKKEGLVSVNIGNSRKYNEAIELNNKEDIKKKKVLKLEDFFK